MDIFADILRSARPYFRQAAVNAAHQLDLFSLLGSRSHALGDASDALGVAPHRLDALLGVLAVEGLVTLQGDAYQLAVAPPAPAELPPDGWGALAQVLRSGEPLDPHGPPSQASGAQAPSPALAAYQLHLAQVGAPAAAALAEACVPPGASHVLDVGGGVGTYAAAALRVAPSARATLVDMPPVLELAAAWLATHSGADDTPSIADAQRAEWSAARESRALGLAQRVALVPGPFESTALAADVDVALLVNVLHLHGPAACRPLIAHAAATLAPGGRLVVKDLDPHGPDAALPRYFALNMALYTPLGRVYDAATVADWLRDAGLDDARTISVPARGASWIQWATRRP